MSEFILNQIFTHHGFSSRGYGRESSLSSRARSTELQEILQQLEEAWPTQHSQPIWQAPSSFTDGSQYSTDEFLYPPRSPSISSESSRTLSRAKVLSSHKLTASLKSLNYLGRPASTELGSDTRSVTSPDIPPRSFLPQHVTARRSKSAYWTGTPTPAELRNRPKTSHHAARVPSGGEGFPVIPMAGGEREEEGVPVIEEETGTQLAEAEEGFDGSGISVQVSSPTMGISDQGDSMPIGIVAEENEGQIDLDRVSVASSVQQEQDIMLPSDGEEADEADGKKDRWMDTREDGIVEEGSGEGDELSVTRPLEPHYTGVLQDDSEILPSAEKNEETQYKSEQGSLPGSRSASRTDQQSGVMRPASVISSRTASRVGFVAEEQDKESIQSAPVELTQDGTNDQKSDSSQQQKMDTLLLDHATQQLENQAKYASSMSGSVDRPEPDPETLVSLQPYDQESRDDSKSIGKAASEISQAESRERPQPTPEPKSALPTSEISVAGPPSEDSSSVSEKKVDDLVQKPLSVGEEEKAPSLEEKAGEPSAAAKDDETGDMKTEVSSGAGVTEEVKAAPPSPSPSPSPAVTKEAEAPIAQPKDILQKEEKDEIKSATEKKTATKQPASPRKTATHTKPKPPGKGGKLDKKGAADKSYVNAMDITSVQPEKTDTDADETVVKKKKMDSPRKKEAYRPPPPPPKVKVTEKKELLIPDHMKDALGHSDIVSQAELENELEKMKHIVDESLGMSSVLPEDAEGLTEEELREAEEALRARMDEAQRKMQEVVDPGSVRSSSPEKPKKEAEVKGKKGKKKVDDKKAEERARKEAEKEQKRQERLKRLEEAKALQELIANKEAQRRAKEEEAALRAMEMEEQVEMMRAEEEAIEQAEEDAREQLAALRKVQREEREARRRADLEKKKQDAINKREKEKAMMEAARRKEQEMLDRIADSEMRRALKEEEDRKRDEEERLAQERFE
ncbi:hypothetical protein BaRGS_00014466, partial [Batillaria attramentaria]